MLSTYFNHVYDDYGWWDITISEFMEERYNLMIYVGIDVTKLNNFSSAISHDHSGQFSGISLPTVNSALNWLFE